MIEGTLLSWFETGLEGIVWAVHEDGKAGYSGLNPLRDGDHLQILEADGTLIWEGTIDLDREVNRRPYPFNPGVSGHAVRGCWVKGLQRGVDLGLWFHWFQDEKCARLRKLARPMSFDDLPLLPLDSSLDLADRHYYGLTCRGCQRTVRMGIRRAVRLAGGQRTEDWLKRLRCVACGHRGAGIQLLADVRNHETIEREGLLSVTQEK
ncbi:hypothetical protein [Sabulicella rubraurantiaca]|uniref:hypothetical protein n=1 Tax=Sabulicella rubraurantiaca TaxID=2811429 RepID=UPI001A96B1E3|nr:hypothetical protein [Sabulicella rubraurantiaca]